MLNRAILPGEQRFSKERWVNDILNECYFNDCLWGYTIHVVKELRTCDPVVFTDGVLYNLIRMGVMDWTGENTRGNQSTQATCLATVLVSRLIQITNANRANVSVQSGEWDRFSDSRGSSTSTLPKPTIRSRC